MIIIWDVREKKYIFSTITCFQPGKVVLVLAEVYDATDMYWAGNELYASNFVHLVPFQAVPY